MSFVEAEGDLPLLTPSNNGTLFGAGAAVGVDESRKGTVKEVQTISTFPGADGVVNATTSFFLKFRGQVTGVIDAVPLNASFRPTGGCDATAREVQEVNMEHERTRNKSSEGCVLLLFFSYPYSKIDQLLYTPYVRPSIRPSIHPHQKGLHAHRRHHRSRGRCAREQPALLLTRVLFAGDRGGRRDGGCVRKPRGG